MKKYVIHFSGGLANRMFQLAFALNVQNMYGEIYYDDKAQKAEFEHENIDVSRIFPNLPFKPMPPNMYRYGGMEGVVGKIARRIPFFTNERYYICHSDNYNEKFILKLNKPGYIIGTFQNEKYFKSISDKVIKLFTFVPVEKQQNIDFIKETYSCESVAVHVRKGDGYATWKLFQGTCGVEYYKAATNYIKEHFPKAKFYIFTDTPSWVADNMQWLNYERIVNWNPTEGWGNHWDMQLMSLCKHNIIANSTYSWWGAWLNQNPEKIVVAPKDWFSASCIRQSYLIPQTWIKI